MLFLPHEITKLTELIEKTQKDFSAIMKSIGESAEAGNKAHDNFGVEEGSRQAEMLSRRLRELINLRSEARVVNAPTQTEKVNLGHTAIVRDVATGQVIIVKIVGYSFTLENDENTVSYCSPLGRALMGARVGERRRAVIAGQNRAFQILEIKLTGDSKP